MALLARPPAPASLVVDLARIVGAQNVSSLDVDRLAYARDAWVRDRLGALSGAYGAAPGVLVWPESTEDVSRILQLAVQADVPVVPWGAGSGRLGGARPRRGGIVMDLKRMKAVRVFEPDDLRIEVEAGIIGSRLEGWLAGQGYTLGHFPSSLGNSTVGGWLATRAAGHSATRYGKIEDMTLGVEVVTAGRVRRLMLGPRPPDGPDFNALVVGSEGAFGAITAAELRIRPRPASRQFAAFRFRELSAGLEAVRRILRASIRPAAVRLYDGVEARIQPRGQGAPALNLELLAGVWKRWSGDAEGSFVERLGHTVRRTAMRTALGSPLLLNQASQALPFDGLLVLVFEGPPSLATAERMLSSQICQQEGGQDQGPGPAEAWFSSRHTFAFNEARLFDGGLFVDAIDAAVTWDRALPLYRAVRRAVARDAIVGAHFAHAYSEGCSVEFTFVGRSDADVEAARERYDRIWRNALGAIHEAGGTIGHHLGVGEAKADSLPREHGPGGDRLLGALKRAFDPAYAINPGALGLVAAQPVRRRAVRRATSLPESVASAVGERNVLRSETRTVVRPPDEGALAAVLRVVNAHGLSVFSDQTGFRPPAGAIRLDLNRFEGVRRLSDHSLFVEVEAGVVVSRLEHLLRAHGLTLGPVHPRAWTRSVGAGVSRHLLIRRGIALGDLGDLCFAIRALLPDGSAIETRAVPRSSTGPGLERAFIGGHGRLGVITKATLRVAVRSEFDRELHFDFPNLESAVACAQRIIQRSVRPAAARVFRHEGTVRFAILNRAVSEELAQAEDAIVASAAASAAGKRVATEGALAEGGVFDLVVEVAQRWSRATRTVDALISAGAHEVWLDFLAPEAVGSVARLPSNDVRRAVVDAALGHGGRIVAGLRAASPIDTDSYAVATGASWREPPGNHHLEGRSGPYDDILRSLGKDLDPNGVLRAVDNHAGRTTETKS